MRLILAILLLTATNSFAAISTTQGHPLTCYAEKPVLFGKFPVTNTEMNCVSGIQEKPQIEKHPFGDLIINYDLKAYFQEKERIVFIFFPR